MGLLTTILLITYWLGYVFTLFIAVYNCFTEAYKKIPSKAIIVSIIVVPFVWPAIIWVLQKRNYEYFSSKFKNFL